MALNVFDLNLFGLQTFPFRPFSAMPIAMANHTAFTFNLFINARLGFEQSLVGSIENIFSRARLMWKLPLSCTQSSSFSFFKNSHDLNCSLRTALKCAQMIGRAHQEHILCFNICWPRRIYPVRVISTAPLQVRRKVCHRSHVWAFHLSIGHIQLTFTGPLLLFCCCLGIAPDERVTNSTYLWQGSTFHAQ